MDRVSAFQVSKCLMADLLLPLLPMIQGDEKRTGEVLMQHSYQP